MPPTPPPRGPGRPRRQQPRNRRVCYWITEEEYARLERYRAGLAPVPSVAEVGRRALLRLLARTP